MVPNALRWWFLALLLSLGDGSSLTVRNELANSLDANAIDNDPIDNDPFVPANEGGLPASGEDDAGEDDAGKDEAVEGDTISSDGCPPGYERLAGNRSGADPNWCYEICEDQFKPDWRGLINGESLCLLYEWCPSGFTETSGHCWKTKTYGRGWGKVPKFKCKWGKCYSRCDHDKQRCLGLCYKKCDDGFEAGFANGHGCNLCSQKCPKVRNRQYKDEGEMCQKPCSGVRCFQGHQDNLDYTRKKVWSPR
jgi:hypothetical protein